MGALRRTVLTVCTTVGLLAAAAGLPAGAAETPPTNIVAVRGVAKATGYPTLTNLRWGAHTGFDRAVFTFSGGTPAYRVGYGTLRGLGTGTAIPLAGNADLIVDFEFARAHNDAGQATYPLTTRDPGLTTLKQVKWGGDYEGYVRAGLGLRDIVGFRVFTLTGPPRVVVDVAHRNAFSTATYTRAAPATDYDVNRVRAARHPGWDRLVFDVTGSAPSMTVRYAAADSSRLLVKLDGRSRARYLGPSPVSFGLPAVRSVRLGSAYDGVLVFSVTTARRAGFRVSTLSSPTRLVIDVKH